MDVDRFEMEQREKLESDSVDFIPNEHIAATKIYEYLEEEDLIRLIDSDVTTDVADTAYVEVSDLHSLKQLGKLALFVFKNEDKENLSNGRGFNHFVLDDGSIATLWVDGQRFQVLGNVQSKVKRRPLAGEMIRHSHGKCDICPTINSIRFNYGQSDFNNPQRSDPPLPETSKYAKSETNEMCLTCKEYISDWFSQLLDEKSEYLWILGGSGIHYDLPIKESDYDFLDILNDSQPPTETEVSDIELNQIYSNTSNKDSTRLGSETGAELLLNQIIGIQMYSEFEFDDIILNCKCEHPIEISNELDIVLIDYSSQKMVVIETTTAKSKNNRISKKQEAAIKLKALTTYYDELDLEYIYLTTEEFPGDIHFTSGTWLFHERMNDFGIPFKIISQPHNLDDTCLNTSTLPTSDPEDVDETLSCLYEHLITELQSHIKEFVEK